MKEFIKKHKKVLIIFIVVILLVVLGVILANTVFKSNKDDIINPDDPTTNEFEKYLKDSIKGFDEDSIADFVTSTDNVGTVSGIYWGAMYSGSIGDDLKILYSLYSLIYKNSDLIDYLTGANMFDEDTGLADISLSLKFINKVLDAKFKDTTIEADTVLTEFFNGINLVYCDDEYCMISLSNSIESGSSSDGSYETTDSSFNKVSGGYEYTTSYYFSEIQFDGDMKFGIYDNAMKTTTYCETTLTDILSFDKSKITENCNSDGTFTYSKVKFNFDKNYKFIDTEEA